MKMRAVLYMAGVPSAIGHVWKEEELREMVSTYSKGAIETIAGKTCLTAEVDVPMQCSKCDGCGQIADTEDQEPWSRWSALPMQSAGAVYMGLVKPKTCPTCHGSGLV